MKPSTDASPSGSGWVALAVLIFALASFGQWYYRDQEAAARRTVSQNLESIAALKVGQIMRWRQDLLGEADLIMSSRYQVDAIERWLGKRRADDLDFLIDRFRGLQKAKRFSDIVLVDALGQVRLSLSGRATILPETTQRVLAAALKNGKASFADLPPDPDRQSTRLDVVAPLFFRDGRVLGAVILRNRADDFLFPLIESWPIQSATAEILLLRQEGDSALLLNPPRRQRRAALKPSLPLDRQEAPSVLALKGGQGMFEGEDHQGVPALSVLKAVPDSPWFLAAKIDSEEALADWRGRSVLILAALAVFSLATIVGFLWLRARLDRYRALYRAESARREAERDFSSTLIDSLPGVFYVITPEGRFLRWNATLARLTGRSDEEMAQISPLDLFAGAERELIGGRIAACFEVGQSTAEASLVAKDGSPQPHYFTGRRVVLNGRPLLVGCGVDMSSMKAMERELDNYRQHLEEQVAERTAQLGEVNRSLAHSEHFIRTIADNLPIMVSYWDKNLRCRFANVAYSSWFARSAVDMLGIRVQDLLGEDRFRSYEPAIRKVLNGERQSFERTMSRTDGSIMYGWATYIPDLVDGEVQGFYILVSDVTEPRLAELRLTALNEELARRADDAEAATQAKSDFLANMSHEIRTPMNAVLGLAQVGLRESAGRRVQPTFQRIIDAGQHLLAVINDILDFSKIEAGKLVVEKAPFILGEAIDRAIGLTALQAHAKGLDFRVVEARDLAETMVGDSMRLTQALVNLISNAIKFTERGGVTLSLSGRDDRLCLRVADTGIGMVPEEVERIFAPFEQADSSTTRRFGGTGLGLAISKRIVEAMGGDIKVHTRPGEGTCFDLELPGLARSRQAPLLPFSAVCLVGLRAGEAENFAADLRALGIHVDVLAPAQALPPADCFVVAADALQGLHEALPEGIRPFVVTTPGIETPLPDIRPRQMTMIERPLRARHLLCAGHGGASSAPAFSARLPGLRILAAEDNDINRLVLGDILVREGAVVTFACDGRQALQRIEAQGVSSFDMVLMDIQMPVMDGLTASRQLRALAPALPVIGLTAHAFPEESDKCLAAGMVAHVTKPIDIDVLVAAILRHAPGPRGAATPAVAGRREAEAPVEERPAGAAASGFIDWAAVSKRYNGRSVFIAKLLQLMLSTHRETAAKLRAAAASHDAETVALIAHSLKGNAGAIEAASLAELAGRVEQCARVAAAGTPALAEQLAGVVERVCAELAGRMQENH